MAEFDTKTYIDSYGNYFAMYAAEIEVDTVNNRSLVQYGLNLHVVPGGSVESTNMSAGVTGKNEFLGHKYYGPGVHTLIENTQWFGHEYYGEGIALLNWWFSANFGSWSGNEALPLTKIDIYPVLNSGSDFKDTENPVFDITVYQDFPLRVKLEAGGDDHLVVRDLPNRGSQIYTLELTSEERALLRSMMVDDVLEVRETVCALRGEEEISWSYKDYHMTKGSSLTRVRVNGQWKEATVYVRVNGQWKEAKPYIRVNGQWKEGI